MENEAVAFTDGASKGNPGPGGWGAIVVASGRALELGGREERTTNNRMELTGAREALLAIAPFRVSSIVVHTDSSYVINGITKWIKGWEAKGWVTSKKEEVQNADLWRDLSEAVDACGARVEWKYVGGHVGIAGNERADRIASGFADGSKVELFDGPASVYGIDVSDLGHDEERKKAKSGSSSRSRAAAHSYVSEIDGVVMVHATWAECEARVKGKRARFKKAASADEERALVREFSRK